MSSPEIEFDEANDLVTFTLNGVVSVSDIIRLGDEHFLVHATNRSIWDFRNADLSEIVVTDMPALNASSRDASTRRQTPRAALIADDDGKRALLKLYGAIAEAGQTNIAYRIVADMVQAMDWIASDAEDWQPGLTL